MCQQIIFNLYQIKSCNFFDIKIVSLLNFYLFLHHNAYKFIQRHGVWN